MVAKAGNLAGSKKNRIIKIEIQETSFQNMVKTRITEEDKIHWKNRSRLGQCAGADWDTFDAAKLMIFSETVAF